MQLTQSPPSFPVCFAYNGNDKIIPRLSASNTPEKCHSIVLIEPFGNLQTFPFSIRCGVTVSCFSIIFTKCLLTVFSLVACISSYSVVFECHCDASYLHYTHCCCCCCCRYSFMSVSFDITPKLVVHSSIKNVLFVQSRQ